MLKISNWLLSWSENTGTGLSQWQGFLGRKDRHSCLGGGSAGPDGWRDIVWRSEWASLFSRGGFPADCQGKVACLVKDGVRMWLWMCPPEAEPLSWLLLLLFWWNYLDKSKLRREGWFCLSRSGGTGAGNSLSYSTRTLGQKAMDASHCSAHLL